MLPPSILPGKPPCTRDLTLVNEIFSQFQVPTLFRNICCFKILLIFEDHDDLNCMSFPTSATSLSWWFKLKGCSVITWLSRTVCKVGEHKADLPFVWFVIFRTHSYVELHLISCFLYPNNKKWRSNITGSFLDRIDRVRKSTLLLVVDLPWDTFLEVTATNTSLHRIQKVESLSNIPMWGWNCLYILLIQDIMKKCCFCNC